MDPAESGQDLAEEILLSRNDPLLRVLVDIRASLNRLEVRLAPSAEPNRPQSEVSSFASELDVRFEESTEGRGQTIITDDEVSQAEASISIVY